MVRLFASQRPLTIHRVVIGNRLDMPEIGPREHRSPLPIAFAPAGVDREPQRTMIVSFRFILQRDPMILITGATGFVGRQLVRAMRSRFSGRPMRILSRATPPLGVL